MKPITCRIPDSLYAALQQRMRGDKETCDHIVAVALSRFLEKPIHTLFQVSTSAALVEGVYQGAVRVSERTRIARDLHDTLLQSLQELLLNFHSVTYLLPDRPVEARSALETAIENARHAIIEGRDAVEGLRSVRHEGGDLEATIGRLSRELAAYGNERASPDFHVNVEGATRSLAPIVGDEVDRIAIEVLRNAFLHARARRIEVEIWYHSQEFRLRVRDNGKGIDAETLQKGRDGHYGITGMYARAKLVQGKLVFWSELGSGTEVELTVPASLAYARLTESLPVFSVSALLAKLRRRFVESG